MKSSFFFSLWCILLTSRWTSSQDTDCLTVHAKKGECILIVHCPALLKIAKSPLVSESERKYLQAHFCGDRKVCCEKPSITTATTTTTTISENDNKGFQASSLLSNEKDCGLDSAGFRIYDGDRTNKEQFRWTVALDYNLPNKKGVRCGGSLINTRYVLTAAHCVDIVRNNKQDLTIRLGEWNIDQNPDCEEFDEEDCNPEVIFARVDQIIIHPGYKKQVHDIALLKMKQALPKNYTTHILPICVPLSTELMQDSFVNKNVTVVGWGRNENGTKSRHKMYAEITTISNQRCEDELEESISDNKMCAKSLTGIYREACDGDSGGPLQIQINGTYYLIGIISHGPRCGQTTLPAVYTRITSYVDWILKQITE
uniref:CLIP domain-containing serine protease n=1 Tax=Aedes albopictus TaxID=7160 RepID=A0A1W7R7B9_AEDAL